MKIVEMGEKLQEAIFDRQYKLQLAIYEDHPIFWTIAKIFFVLQFVHLSLIQSILTIPWTAKIVVALVSLLEAGVMIFPFFHLLNLIWAHSELLNVDSSSKSIWTWVKNILKWTIFVIIVAGILFIALPLLLNVNVNVVHNFFYPPVKFENPLYTYYYNYYHNTMTPSSAAKIAAISILFTCIESIIAIILLDIIIGLCLLFLVKILTFLARCIGFIAGKVRRIFIK